MLHKTCKLCQKKFFTKFSFQNFCCKQHSKSFYKKTPKGRLSLKKYEQVRIRKEPYKLKQKIRSKKQKLSQFGLSIEEYEFLKIDQKNLCKICMQPEKAKINGKLISLAVDHCHKTGKVRGLLCRDCNIGIALLKESPYVFRRAIKYLGDPGDED